MFSDYPFVEPVDHWATVWVGDLNAAELQEYLYEPGGAQDDEPISQFGRDLDDWYDHDFIWSGASDLPLSIRELCIRRSIVDDALIAEVEKRCNNSHIHCLLILWNYRTIDDSERSFAEGRLTCLGSWEQEAPLTD